MHRKFTALILMFALLILCFPAAAANQIVEASDPKLFSALMEEGSPHRILLQTEKLTSFYGADRIIHSASTGSYLLEYESDAAAEAALPDLQAQYGKDSCWLDSPSEGASILGEAESEKQFRSWGAQALELDLIQENPQIKDHLNHEPITVAIIDTGLDPESTFWADRAVSAKSYDFVNASSQFSEVLSGSAAGHGTMVASILDDLLFDQAELMILRVFDNSGSASRVRVLNALEYAIENGADVINLSLGWEGADDSYTFLNQLLDKAHEQGIAVICASGNRGTDANTCYPASYETTISVAAANHQDEHPNFSNYGSSVTLSAPGQRIKTIGPEDRIMSSSGTSFAAPHITAVAASLLALNPEQNADQIREALISCARDLGDEGWDPYFGWGMPQTKSAAESLLTHDWDDGQIAVEPTFDTEGECTFTCTVCGEQRTEILPVVVPTPTPTPEPTATPKPTASPAPATTPSPHPTSVPALNHPFQDVPERAYYSAPVLWAINHNPQITMGTDSTHFSPDAVCTRAQVVTFLWRAMGQPEPEASTNPFKDVKKSDYYFSAVLWAVEQGITLGTSADQFSPSAPCTRAHVVTFLWRAENMPVTGKANPFLDVSANQYFYHAVLWAGNHNPRITEGTDASHFSPSSPCTRGQIVTFLYRDLAD